MSRQKSRGCRLRHLDKSWCGLFFVQWLPEPSLGLWRWSNADGYRTLWPGAAMILSKPGICRPETEDTIISSIHYRAHRALDLLLELDHLARRAGVRRTSAFRSRRKRGPGRG